VLKWPIRCIESSITCCGPAAGNDASQACCHQAPPHHLTRQSAKLRLHHPQHLRQPQTVCQVTHIKVQAHIAGTGSLPQHWSTCQAAPLPPAAPATVHKHIVKKGIYKYTSTSAHSKCKQSVKMAAPPKLCASTARSTCSRHAQNVQHTDIHSKQTESNMSKSRSSCSSTTCNTCSRHAHIRTCSHALGQTQHTATGTSSGCWFACKHCTVPAAASTKQTAFNSSSK
jgi:hypothetical protein